jgi:DNA-binding transcriptional MerR regulator
MSLRNMSTAPQAREQTYSISDLAREFDVTPRTIRFYEDQGLLAPQRSGSRRIYAKRDYVRLKLILRGKRLGLSLSEVAAMFDLYDSARDEKPQLAQFVAALAERREQLERQRADIDEMLGEIAVFEAQSRKLLAGGGKAGTKTRKTAA